MAIYFSDYFGVSESALEEYGAFDISLVTDLPLFIDPFLLFGSPRPEYQALHDDIIRYLRFLRTKSEQGGLTEGHMKAWYYFSEVRQNWLGFCEDGNRGRGLGSGFASALNSNLVHVFIDFGNEKVTRGSHLEKLTLIRSGVGRDMISDFTTNLIKQYLLEYTEAFAEANIASEFVRSVSVPRACFDYDTERWAARAYKLPIFDDDFVVLTPKDILTKDDTWISHADMMRRFEDIPDAVENDQLRAEINNYFYSHIPKDTEPSDEEVTAAVDRTLRMYPELIDYYIKIKEDTGDQAAANSNVKVLESQALYVRQFGALALALGTQTPFYSIPGNTKDETREKIEFFKDVIENKGGHKLFYSSDGTPIKHEVDVHIMFRLVWFGTPSDVSREVNDGRGPVDFKVSRGAADKTMVEFKLAGNSQLKRNLSKQLEIYKKAGDAQAGFKVIVFFSEAELVRVQGIVRDLGLVGDTNIVLVDARNDNKPSGSRA